jgi:site-specific DNA recombinase
MQAQSIPTSARQPIRAAVYCRVSTLGQEEEGTSLVTQEAAGRAYCERAGYHVLHVAQDTHSGADMRRPGLDHLRAVAEAGGIDVIVAHAVDRLSRKQSHMAILIDAFEAVGVRVEFVTEKFEDTAMGQFLRSAKTFAGEVEREKFVERTVRGKRARLTSGKIHRAGREFYGYRRDVGRHKDEPDNGKREIYEPEARVVRWIYEAIVLHGWSLRRIAADLNARGVPTPSEGKVRRRKGATEGEEAPAPRWHGRVVALLVRRTEYKGETIGWKWLETGRGKKRTIVERPESDWVRLPDGTTPRLVSDALWAQAQARLGAEPGTGGVSAAKALATASTRNVARPHLLRGLIWCTVCGRAMSPDRRVSGKRIYRCTSHCTPGAFCGSRAVDAEAVEAQTWAEVTRRIENPDLVMAEAEQLAGGPDPLVESSLASAKRLVAKLERQQSNLTRLAAIADEAAGAALLPELSRVARERGEAEAAAAALEAQLVAAKAAAVERAAVEDHLRELRGELAELTVDERRRALVAFAVRVEGNGEQWTGWGRLGPAAGEGVLFTQCSSTLHNTLAFTFSSAAD